MNKICSRKECNDLGIYKINSNTSFYCPKHYRFSQMRSRAQRCRKFIPTWEECEILLFVWCPTFKCPICNVKLKWHKNKNGLKNVISLQHNNNDTMMFICCSCNTAHGHSRLGDDYFKISSDKKYCYKCNKILDKNKFGKNQTKKDRLQGHCRECQILYNKERKLICQKI